ncbi:MAG: DUF3619 family protein [Burkholderiaceae bacterium]|nr:DUF3619 family protein [Burkholderiaceae bacterium]
MNEPEFGERIRRALDEQAARVPYRVASRLAAARMRAIERLPRSVEANVTGPVLATGAGHAAVMGAGDPDSGEPTPLAGLLVVVLPLLLLAFGLVSIAQWSDSRRAEEMAEIDAAVITDDIPIAVYADRGFGVFLKNTRQ